MSDIKLETIHIRVSPEVKRKIDDMAAQRGRTVSEYARRVLTDEAHNEEIMDAIRQLTKIMEGCLLFSMGAVKALPTFVAITNDSKRNVLEDLYEAIQEESKGMFTDFIGKHLGGISQLGIKKKKEKRNEF